ncbi:hypothetical protein [Pyxidicoccus trucidator]|uniref:hypothetical protein n=1 Tax=Pyxidicoccus trucidator TaxID=2709662 RepID=UPI0013D97428|nr:hypothetical protein [Pyxidicoccus trucidator]
MSRINSFTSPRVQTPATQASSGPSRTGFGSLVQQGGMSAAANRPGDPLMMSGGAVVSSALASVGSSPHSGLMNSYLSAVGRKPIAPEGAAAQTQGATTAQPGSEQAKQEQAMMDLAALSAATLGNSIIHMGNKNKISLDT